LLPTLLGLATGQARRKGWPIAHWLGGEAYEPRAWDYAFNRLEHAIVRVKLKSGDWVAGLYGTTEDGKRSYASGHPEDGDLYLVRGLQVDSDTGALLTDNDGYPLYLPDQRSLLLSRSDAELLDIQEFPS
jgi:hypothetical protein